MKTVPISIPQQPDDESCGLACLLGVYEYFDLPTNMDALKREVRMLESGGTLGVNLAVHALKNGFDAELVTYNLQIFDPTWASLSNSALIEKLEKQKIEKSHDLRLYESSAAYIKFLKLGGRLKYADLKVEDLKGCFDANIPIIAGLSSTYLYGSKREIPDTTELDDIRGYPAGHFVVLNGYSDNREVFSVCDPYSQNPYCREQRVYEVNKDHLLTSLFLGIVTYDANFIILKKKI